MALLLPAGVFGQDWSGHVAGELRWFPQPALFGQDRVTGSIGAEPEYYQEWGPHSIVAVPFLRIDSADRERSHFDVRELMWQRFANDWELRAGIGRVFWGVTESQHLVDIINQTDLVENIDTEDKLGQPMVGLGVIRPWGRIDFFVLPGFRERTFPGADGRFRFPVRIAGEAARYESDLRRKHVDFAVRWAHVLGDWDVGLSHFHGTSREPVFLEGIDESGAPALIPFYEVIDQTGLDIQATKGRWLWKLEMISRSGREDRSNALTGGFEFTFADVKRSGVDIGLLAEYLFDDRGERATTVFEDDIFLATRLELNDVQSTRLLAGAVIDRTTGASFFNLEASRRLGSSWRLSIEGRSFVGVPPTDYAYALRNDDHLQIEIGWYF